LIDVLTIGDTVVDLIVRVDHFPRANEESIPASKPMAEVGGAANFLIMAARLGLECGLIGCVGGDEYGRLFLDALSSEGVDVSRARVRRNESTTLCINLLDKDGRHAFLSVPGASSTLDHTDLNKVALAATKVLYLSGYALTATPTRNYCVRALRACRDWKIPIVFDPSPALNRIPKRVLVEMISSSEAVLPSQMEASMISGTRSQIRAAQYMLEMGAERVVMKLGSHGSLYVDHSQRFREAAPRIYPIDTTGAGDVFNASVVFCMVREIPMQRALRLANLLGALTTLKTGAGRNVPKIDEAVKFASDKGLEEIIDFLPRQT